jgi:hypothetical protein
LRDRSRGALLELPTGKKNRLARCGSGLAITHCCNARRDPNFRKYIDVSNAEWQDMAPIFKIVKDALKSGEAK